MLPGGKAEPGEDAITALCRELQEELDLNLPAAALAPLGQFQAAAANEAETWISARVFLARLQHNVSAAEVKAQPWLARSDTPPEPLVPLLREQLLPLLWPTAR